ncbi:MAG: PrsW family glutamic-type intramembrane protease [Propionibacteriaceae bacterium]|nr:PrsW family glutamic-type intramembrane protease [Propionibacteriaceae bacterium]
MIDSQAILTGQTKRGVPPGVLATIIISALCLAGFLLVSLISGQVSFLLASLLALITLVPMLGGVLALDRVEPEPVFMLVTVFLWGAGVAVILSLLFETIGVVAIYSAGRDTDIAWMSAVVLAPIIEEATKGLVLFGILWFRRKEINGITDGVVYAAVTALGFAAAENIVYYMNAGGSMVFVFLLRGLLFPMCHPVFTSMTGIGIAMSIGRRDASRVYLPIGGLILAMVLHAMWNGSAYLGLGALAIVFLIVVAVMVTIILVLRKENLTVITHIQQHMVQYMSTGLVTEADLYMLSSLKTRKDARNWARTNFGKPGFEAMRDYQQACTHLTFIHDQTAQGVIDAYTFVSRQGALLALMQATRQAFAMIPETPLPVAAQPGVAPVSMAPPTMTPPPGFISPQSYQPQSYPPQGFPPQGFPDPGFAPQGYADPGLPPQGFPDPTQGFTPVPDPTQRYAPQGFPDSVPPPQGFPDPGLPPQGFDPVPDPTQAYAPTPDPTQGYAPQGYPDQGQVPQGYLQTPPQEYPPPQG